MDPGGDEKVLHYPNKLRSILHYGNTAWSGQTRMIYRELLRRNKRRFVKFSDIPASEVVVMRTIGERAIDYKFPS